MSWFKKIFLILAIIGLVTPGFVFADKFGIDSAAQGTDLIQTTQTIPEIIGSIIGIALSFVGIVFFLLVLYAGFTWMTAFGNEEKVTTSKSIMEHAAIGLIIVLSAYAISKFVFGALAIGQTSNQSQNNTPVQTPLDERLGCCSSGVVGGIRRENIKHSNCSIPDIWDVGTCDQQPGCCRNNAPGGQTLPSTEPFCRGVSEDWHAGSCN